MSAITIDRKALSAAIAAVMPAVERRKSDVKHLVRIAADNKGAWIEATSRDLMLRRPLGVRRTGTGSAAVYANKLCSVVANGLPKGDVTITLDKRPSLTVGDTTVWLDSPEVDWPTVPTIKGDILALTASDVDTIRRVAVAASTDWARPILRSISLDDGSATATDSYRLITASLSVKPPRPLMLSLDCALVMPVGGVLLRVGKNAVEWGTSTDGGYAPLVDGSQVGFPSWRGLMPTSDPPFTLTVDRRPFLDAVLRAKAVIGTKSAAPVRLTEVEGGISLGVRERGHDLFAERCAMESAGEAITVAVNAGFLADLVRTSPDDRVNIAIFDALKPVLLSSGALRCLLMPIRIEDSEEKRKAA